MTLLQVRLHVDWFLRASLVEHDDGPASVEFSVGREVGDHDSRVSDATAHALVQMFQIKGRGA